MGFFGKLFARKPALNGRGAFAMREAAEPSPSAQDKIISDTRDGLLILHWVAMSDDYIQKKERDVIIEYCRERAAAGVQDTEAMARWVRGQHPDQETIRDAVFRLVTDPEHAQFVRRSAQSLVRADGVLENREIQTIQLMYRFFAEAEAQLSRD